MSTYPVCRCCLCPGALVSIFSGKKAKTYLQYNEMLKYCCGISVSEHDGLPAQLCKNCSTKLKSSYKFKLKCIESNAALLDIDEKCLQNNDDSQIDIKIEKLKCDIDKSQCNEENDLSVEQKFLPESMIEGNKNLEKYDQVKSIKTEIQSESTHTDYGQIIKAEVADELNGDEMEYSTSDLTVYVLPTKDIKTLRGVVKKRKSNQTKDKCNVSRKSKVMKKSPKLECDTCDHVSHSLVKLEQHINWVHCGIKPYHCSICDEDYSNEKRHRERHQNTFSATCEQCGEKFTTKKRYQYHMESHENNEYKCYCGASFKVKDYLITHKRAVHGPKKFMCHFCSRAYSLKHALVDHIRVHTGEKPYGCELCQKRFRRSGAVKKHKANVHSDIRSFQCQTCHKDFKSRGVLRKHMVVHADTRSFACRVCHQPFGRVDNRNVHERSVHGISKEEAKIMWPSLSTISNFPTIISDSTDINNKI